MRLRHALLPAASALALLAACGGGSGTSTSDTPSRASIQSAGANSAVLPNDSTEAAAAALSTLRAVAEAGSTTSSANVAVACPGGGQAAYTMAGSNNPLEWLNQRLDAGEIYAISFTGCRSEAGAPTLDGSLTLTVTTSNSVTLTVSTATSLLQVALPQRTIRWNGNSTISQTTATSGSDTTTATRWASPQVQVRSERSGAAPRLFNLSNVNYERTIVSVNGVPVRQSGQGGASMQADLALFTWFITLATLGPVLYDTTGVLVQGTWLIDLPDDRITVSLSSQRVSFQFDLGANGSIDLSFTIDLDTFLADAA